MENSELDILQDVLNSIVTEQKHVTGSIFYEDIAECLLMQEDELIVLKSIFEHDFQAYKEGDHCFSLRVKANYDDETYTNENDVLLWFSIPSTYPNVIPIIEIEGPLSYDNADKLYDELLDKANTHLGTTMLYDLFLIAKDFVQSHFEMLKKQQNAENIQNIDQSECENINEDSEDLEGPSTVPIFGRSISTLTPSNFTGPLHKILQTIPTDYQVVSVENVMRQDLCDAFNMKLALFNSKYFQLARDNPLECCITPTFVFHGTMAVNVPKIIQTGLKVPGEESGVKVVNGSSLGVGIYLSRDPMLSMNYCEDSENAILLVCSVLPGRMFRISDKSQSARHQNYNPHRYDSVNCDCVYVVFNASQVMPCYAIRVVSKRKLDQKLVTESLKLNKALRDKARESETLDEKRKRLAERAKKFLPYGYGACSNKGREMVIIDAADSSDEDNERDGDYQAKKFLPYGYGACSNKGREMVIIDAADSSDEDNERDGDYQNNQLLPKQKDRNKAFKGLHCIEVTKVHARTI